MASENAVNGDNYAINGSRPSSPPTVHFSEDTTNPPSVDQRQAAKPRSMSNTTISDDNKTIEHVLQECEDEDCAFGWETYVVDHPCGYADAAVKTKQKERYKREEKLSIHTLLHDEENNPLLNDWEDGMIRHVHLPANNMKWVEDLIRRYYHNKEGNKQSRLLRSDFWHGQQHGRRGPIHSRFMRPRCDIIPRGLDELSPTHRDFVISMPYLHWETDEAREKMRIVIEDIVSPTSSKARHALDPLGTRTSRGRKVEDLNLSKWGKKILPKIIIKARRDDSKEAMVRRAEGDEKLLRKHLLSDRPIHIRRTLDQSYYWTLKNTLARDRDQVVYRATVADGGARVVMVDQLWMWILDGKLVITSFPRRWGRKRQDPSGVARTIRERLNDQPNLDNVYDMAIMMIDQCSRFFFDRMAPRDNRPEVMDIFSSAIGDVTEKSTKAYDNFWALIRPNTKRYREMFVNHDVDIWEYAHAEAQAKLQQAQKEGRLLEQLLDINPEGELLKEIKDILDELHMMKKVYSEQQVVVEDFLVHLQQLCKISEEVKHKTKDKASQLVKEVSRRKAEINELTRAAERTADGLKELLDLKQKHANVEEARAGLIRAEEGNKILAATRKLTEESAKQTAEANKILAATQKLSEQSHEQTLQGVRQAELGVRQAELTGKQNRSLMIFTIVTIIFLPLGFFSSVFGMNAPEFGQGQFEIWKQFLIMFPLSIVIIIFSLALALSEDILKFCGATLQLWWARFLQWIGLFETWKKKGERVKIAIETRTERLDELYKDEQGEVEMIEVV